MLFAMVSVVLCAQNVLSSPGDPFNCTYGDNYTGGTWTISEETWCDGVSGDIANNANIIINAKLILTGGSDISMDSSGDHNAYVEVNAGGSLYLNGSSQINKGSGSYSAIYGKAGSVIDIDSSTVTGMGNDDTWPYTGLASNGTLNVRSSTLDDIHTGAFYTRNANGTFSGNIVTDCHRGLEIKTQGATTSAIGPISVTDNVFNRITRGGDGGKKGITVERAPAGRVEVLRNVVNDTQGNGLTISDSVDVDVINNTFSILNFTTGLSITDVNSSSFLDNNISDTTGTNAFCIGLIDDANDNLFQNNILTNCEDYGVLLVDATGSGSPDNNYFKAGKIDSTVNEGFTISSTGTNYLVDVVINADSADVSTSNSYTTGGTLYVLNSTYTNDTSPDHTVYRQWYFDATVFNSKGGGISGANVADFAKNDTLYQWSATAGGGGVIDTQNATEYELSASGRDGYNYHNLTVSYPGYDTFNNGTWVDANKDISITLTGLGVVPEFSSVLMVIVALGVAVTGIAAIRKRNI
ncbi:hypothetical protein GF351_05470 [Candidatus Woesearchaeota archaeon]|nr:hypothetical protein [Candidatus Woesearchaeota archaeon]